MAEKKSETSKDAEPETRPRKTGTRGCGRWVGSCGGNHEGTVSVTGNCACGRKYSKSCSKTNCPGVDWYC